MQNCKKVNKEAGVTRNKTLQTSLVPTKTYSKIRQN